jgi:hypothetical protein
MDARWRCVLGATLVVAAIATACSDDSESGAPTSTSHAGTTTSSTTTSTTMIPALAATEQDVRDCDRTIEPYFRQGPGNPSGLLPAPPLLEGESLRFSGTEDDRSDVSNPATHWGDLNGDGVDDRLVANDAGVFVISGTAPPGSELRDAGVLLTGTSMGGSWLTVPVGDQNGDGAADVSFFGRLVSGRSLLAKSPGRSMAIPEPFADAPHVMSAFRLEPDGAPALARVFGRGQTAQPGIDAGVVVKLDGPESICLVTDNSNIDLDPYQWAGDSGTASVDGVRTPDGHRVVEYLYANRYGPIAYRWDLDA